MNVDALAPTVLNQSESTGLVSANVIRPKTNIMPRPTSHRRHPLSVVLQRNRTPAAKQNLHDVSSPGRLKIHMAVVYAYMLRTGEFLKAAGNVLIFGRPGCGKTLLLSALGDALVRSGHTVCFAPCAKLVQHLLAAKRDLRLPQMLSKLMKYSVLIIDDLGYVQQSREEMEVLFTLIADRYEKASILLSSNLPFSKWESIFKDPMTTAAAIDRLVHHRMILELNVRSARLEEASLQREALNQKASS